MDINIVSLPKINGKNYINNVDNIKKHVDKLKNSIDKVYKSSQKAFSDIKVDIDFSKATKSIDTYVEKLKKSTGEITEQVNQQNDVVKSNIEKFNQVKNKAKETGLEIKNTNNENSKLNKSEQKNKANMLTTSESITDLAGMAADLAGTAFAFGSEKLLGKETGEYVGNAGKGAISGALAGTAILPGIGTAIGAGIGLVSGLLTTYIENDKEAEEAKNKAYQDEVRRIYDLVNDYTSKSLQNGIKLADSAEQTKINMSIAAGSNMTKDVSNRVTEDMIDFSKESPYKTESILQATQSLVNSGYHSYDVKDMIDSIQTAAAGTGTGDAGVINIASVIAQIRESSTLTEEHMQSLSSQNVNVMKEMSTKFNITQEEFTNKLKSGEISSEDALYRLGQVFNEKYGSTFEDQKNSYSGMQTQLENAKNDIDRAKGEGFNEQRKISMSNEIEAYSGKMGEEMKDAYRLIGVFEADVENKHQESIIDAIKEIQETDDYIRAKQNGDEAKMGELYNEAIARAEVKYKNSEEYNLKLQNEKTLVNDTQRALQEDQTYLKFGIEMAKEFLNGYDKEIEGKIYGKPLSHVSKDNEPGATPSTHAGGGSTFKTNYTSTYATGLERVPREGIYHLHEGEKVVPRAFASNYGKSSFSCQVNVSCASTQPEEVGRYVAAEIAKVYEVYGGAA